MRILMPNLLSRRPSRPAAAIALGLVLGTVGIVSTVVADRAGCDVAIAGSLDENAEFTPYELQRTKPVDGLIGAKSDSAKVPDRAVHKGQALDGMARQFTVDASNGAVYAYFLDRDTAGLKHSEFRKLGGIELHQDPGSDSFAAYLLERPGGQAVAVKLGTFDAALTWGDPDVNGTRAHGLYWFDGTNNYSLIGDRSASKLVNIGRTLVC
jgi:hypothetical protein